MKKTCAVVLSILFLFSLCACSKQEDTSEPEYSRQDRNAILQLSDGWYLYYDREEVYDANGGFIKAYCSLDGVNLKYKNLSDFNMRLVNADTGEVTGSVSPSVHYFQMNKTYEDKIAPIAGILENRPAAADLTLKELQGNDISDLCFTLDDVVKVYNAAMENGVKEFGKYMNISVSDIVSDPMLDGYQWQVGYYILSGQIAAVDIELIYADGRYLSDIEEKNLSDAQKELLTAVKVITEQILTSGNLSDIGIDQESVIDHISFNRLYTLLNSIEVENEKNAG